MCQTTYSDEDYRADLLAMTLAMLPTLDLWLFRGRAHAGRGDGADGGGGAAADTRWVWGPPVRE